MVYRDLETLFRHRHTRRILPTPAVVGVVGSVTICADWVHTDNNCDPYYKWDAGTADTVFTVIMLAVVGITIQLSGWALQTCKPCKLLFRSSPNINEFYFFISQNSAVTQLRYGGIFSNHFTRPTNFSQNATVKDLEHRSIYGKDMNKTLRLTFLASRYINGK